MVDVGAKPVSERIARAQAIMRLGPKIALALKKTGALAKGNVIETARIAGIMAAKRTASLIPMCHPLPLDFVSVDTSWRGNRLRIETTARCAARTGVEMEALVAASVAALTVYDMCKSAGKGMVIRDIRLLEKSGGKSGHWKLAGRKQTGGGE
jgi:cyclic pyranopterin phosphate synthase